MQSTPTAKILKLLPKIMLSQGDSAVTPLHKWYLPCISSLPYSLKGTCSPKLPALEIKQDAFSLNWNLI